MPTQTHPTPGQFLNSIFDADPAELAAIRERSFTRTLDLVFAHHPYYRAKFAAQGIVRGDVCSLADLSRLPITTKSDYAAAPDQFRLQLDQGTIEEKILWDVMYTTGSTGGMPAAFYSTTYDYYNILLTYRRMLEIRGVRPTDIIANLNPMTIYPSGAYNRTLHAAATMGIPIVSPLPGNPSPQFRLGRRLDEVIEITARTRATILWGVSSYIRKLVQRAVALKADLSAVRMAFLGGEATSETLRAEVVSGLEALGAKAPWISVSYGHTETQSGMPECRAGSGYHNPAPEVYFWEVVDPATHQPLPDGQPGLVLLTHLDRRGTVMLRYALGDVSAIASGHCPHCGALGERFILVPRRADHRVKIKGMLVDLSALTGLLDADRSIRDYLAIADREVPEDRASMDALRILVVPHHNAAKGILERIAGDVKRTVGITPIVETATIDAVRPADHANKQKKFIDRRLGP